MHFSTQKSLMKNTNLLSRQSGNTLTGIIIGLVIGLSIAAIGLFAYLKHVSLSFIVRHNQQANSQF